jgi:hypothetical protein
MLVTRMFGKLIPPSSVMKSYANSIAAPNTLKTPGSRKSSPLPPTFLGRISRRISNEWIRRRGRSIGCISTFI